MEITFQNRREDFAEFYSHMARHRRGEPDWARPLCGMAAYDDSSQLRCWHDGCLRERFGNCLCGLSVILFLCLNGFLLLLSRGKTGGHACAECLQKTRTAPAPQKDLEVFLLPKRLEADDETLTISSRESLHRWRWRIVERVDLTANCLFIHVGACPVVYLPRRDFASEQEFVEAGKALEALRAANLGKPIGGE